MAKQFPFEESIGIPFVVFDPSAKDRAGAFVDDPVSTEDLYPTLLGLCGITPKQKIPGENLAPLIKGDCSSLDGEGVLIEFVSEHRAQMSFHRNTWRGIRTRNYKYSVLGGADGGKPWQFYDLVNDPHEMQNLINNSQYLAEISRHHLLRRNLLVDTEDHYSLCVTYKFKSLNLLS